jgi:hypothetical protein
MEEHFHIEVCDKANWSLNTFVSYESLLLHDVANGPVKQNLKIYDKTEKLAKIIPKRYATLVLN